MTQTQRKKALKEAQMVLVRREAELQKARLDYDEAHETVCRLGREVRRNEPPTKAMQEALLTMLGGTLLRRNTVWKLRADKSVMVKDSIYCGLRDRELIASVSYGCYGLNDRGREVAEALRAKQEGR